jgi:hypothetical protein
MFLKEWPQKKENFLKNVLKRMATEKRELLKECSNYILFLNLLSSM